MYNQTLSTTTEICLTPDTGFCAEWQKTTETTYQYFDLIIYILIAIIPFAVIALFKRK